MNEIAVERRNTSLDQFEHYSATMTTTMNELQRDRQQQQQLKYRAKTKTMLNNDHSQTISNIQITIVAFMIICLAYNVEPFALNHQNHLLHQNSHNQTLNERQPLLLFTDADDDEDDSKSMFNVPNDQMIERQKRQVSYEDNDEKNKRNPIKKCNRNALNKCGRVFIHSFAFIQPKKASNGDSYLNIKGNDILTTECALRQAFFNCLKLKTSYCGKNNGKNNQKWIENLNDSKNQLNIKLKRRQKRKVFEKRLSDTIWASRLCIFRDSVHVNDF
ncbi:hypothetical protein BLOT_005537 [Blomia tropicalis]|nr:hypothetical protein BLOT_005537 [Blomia tropicalis]